MLPIVSGHKRIKYNISCNFLHEHFRYYRAQQRPEDTPRLSKRDSPFTSFIYMLLCTLMCESLIIYFLPPQQSCIFSFAAENIVEHFVCACVCLFLNHTGSARRAGADWYEPEWAADFQPDTPMNTYLACHWRKANLVPPLHQAPLWMAMCSVIWENWERERERHEQRDREGRRERKRKGGR